MLMLFCQQKADHPFNNLPHSEKRGLLLCSFLGEEHSLKIQICCLKIQMCCSSHKFQVSSVTLSLYSLGVCRNRYTTFLFNESVTLFCFIFAEQRRTISKLLYPVENETCEST